MDVKISNDYVGEYARFVVCDSCEKTWLIGRWSFAWRRPFCTRCGEGKFSVLIGRVVRHPQRRWWKPRTWGLPKRLLGVKDKMSLGAYMGTKA